jgi:hypothetical protein
VTPPPGDAALVEAAAPDAALGPCGLLLDDLEDGDGNILPCIGRNGTWYAANDGTAGTQVPDPTVRFFPVTPGHASAYSAHSSGNGFTLGGAQIGFTFANLPTGGRAQYDVSAHTGVQYWGKSAKTGYILYLNFPDRDSDPAGGVCKPGGAGGAYRCDDHYGKGYTFTTTDWTFVQIPFSALGTDYTEPTTFDKAHVYAVEFHASPKDMPFEMWVDDIAFY